MKSRFKFLVSICPSKCSKILRTKALKNIFVFRWFWKVVRNNAKTEFVAFIGSNYPEVEKNVPFLDACQTPIKNIFMVGNKRRAFSDLVIQRGH